MKKQAKKTKKTKKNKNQKKKQTNKYVSNKILNRSNIILFDKTQIKTKTTYTSPHTKQTKTREK